MKTLLVMLATFAVCLLGFAVMKSMHSPNCESLANEYLSASDYSVKEKILQHGKEIGCPFTK